MLSHDSLFSPLLDARILDAALIFMQSSDAAIQQWSYSFISNIIGMYDEARLELADNPPAIATLLRAVNMQEPTANTTRTLIHTLSMVATVSDKVSALLRVPTHALVLLTAALEDENTLARYRYVV
jgi:hypothetical protein